jgi:hypothetical protein
MRTLHGAARYHSSRFNFRFPQRVSLRSDLNTRSTPWFIARSTPTRAEQVDHRSKENGPGSNGVEDRGRHLATHTTRCACSFITRIL